MWYHGEQTTRYMNLPMNNIELATQDISMALVSVGGIWKIISVFATFIMVPLLFKAFYESLAEYLIQKENDLSSGLYAEIAFTDDLDLRDRKRLLSYLALAKNQKEVYKENRDEKIEKIKERFSFVNLYELVDLVYL